MTALLCVQGWDGQCEPCEGQSVGQDHPLAPGQGDKAWIPGRAVPKAHQLQTHATPFCSFGVEETLRLMLSSHVFTVYLVFVPQIPEFIFHAESSELWRSAVSSTRFERFTA